MKAWITFISILLIPLIIFDLVFDNKQEAFMELNQSILLGALLIGLFWIVSFKWFTGKWKIDIR